MKVDHAVTKRNRFHYEVAVCGGGPAGIAAAAAAATAGCKTLLIERFSRLGGMGTNGLVNQFKAPENPPALRSLFAAVRDCENDSEFLDMAYAGLVNGCGSALLLHATVFDVITETVENRKIVRGILIATPSGPIAIDADRVVDATGDGVVAFLAGATFAMGRDDDGLMQPATVMFRVSGVAHERSMEANGGRANYKFPEGSWNHLTMAARQRGELPWNIGMIRTYMANRETDRYVNATQTNYIDATNVFDITRAELDGRRQIPIVMDFLRRYAPGYEAAYVSGVAGTVGVRETRRFRGMTGLTREDCMVGRRWPDAVVTGCRAILDVHNPAGPGQAEGVSRENPAGKDARPKPYDIPYRCLVPEDTDGMLLAGRCISGDHYAHASYRMQNICMATGAAAGFAAAESIRQGVQPRNTDIAPVQVKLGIKPPLGTPGSGLAERQSPPSMNTKTTVSETCGPKVRWIGEIDLSMPTLGLPLLEGIRKSTLYRAEEKDDAYSHHGYIASHRNILYATWSSHARDEDASGQRVRFSRSLDAGVTWQPAAELFPPHDNVKMRSEQDNVRDRVLIANGFAVVNDTLYAIAEAHLLGEKIAMTPPAGITDTVDNASRKFWTRPGLGRLARAVAAENEGPIFWLVAHPPAPVPGFPVYPAAAAAPEFTETAAAVNAYLARPEHWPSWEFLHHTCHVWAADGHRLCEPTPAWRLPDGSLARIWRDVSRGSQSQYAYFSKDHGQTWSLPRVMPFPDAYSRTMAGNLPDGTAYVINNPGNSRDPLVISLAADGLNFDKHAVIACNAPQRRYEGVAKGVGFQYPHATVAGNVLHVIYSINKEDIETAAIPLNILKQLAG